MANDVPQTPRVFISYRHDSAPHRAAVVKLAQRLRQSGVDARIDRFVANPEGGWSVWQEREIRGADFVLAVCTAEYRRYFDREEEEPYVGAGVRAEADAIRGLLQSGERSPGWCVPILFDDMSEANVPLRIGGSYIFRYPADEKRLLEYLVGVPEVSPDPLGPPPNFIRPVEVLEVASDGAAPPAITNGPESRPFWAAMLLGALAMAAVLLVIWQISKPQPVLQTASPPDAQKLPLPVPDAQVRNTTAPASRKNDAGLPSSRSRRRRSGTVRLHGKGKNKQSPVKRCKSYGTKRYGAGVYNIVRADLVPAACRTVQVKLCGGGGGAGAPYGSHVGGRGGRGACVTMPLDPEWSKLRLIVGKGGQSGHDGGGGGHADGYSGGSGGPPGQDKGGHGGGGGGASAIFADNMPVAVGGGGGGGGGAGNRDDGYDSRRPLEFGNVATGGFGKPPSNGPGGGGGGGGGGVRGGAGSSCMNMSGGGGEGGFAGETFPKHPQVAKNAVVHEGNGQDGHAVLSWSP